MITYRVCIACPPLSIIQYSNSQAGLIVDPGSYISFLRNIGTAGLLFTLGLVLILSKWYSGSCIPCGSFNYFDQMVPWVLYSLGSSISYERVYKF